VEEASVLATSTGFVISAGAVTAVATGASATGALFRASNPASNASAKLTFSDPADVAAGSAVAVSLIVYFPYY
jgi:hypothetical protein